jgi:hypothetical protein
MATKRSTTTQRGARKTSLAALERQVRRLQKALEAERARHEKQLEAVRRAANRRLAVMMQEIATLRHHEARAGALERLLAMREGGAVKGNEDGEDSRLPG